MRHFIYIGPRLFNIIPNDLKLLDSRLMILKYKTKEWIEENNLSITQFLPKYLHKLLEGEEKWPSTPTSPKPKETTKYMTKKKYTRKTTTKAPRNITTKVKSTRGIRFKTTPLNITLSTFVPTARFYLNPYHKYIEDMFNTYAVLLFTNHNCEKSDLARAAFAKYNFTNYEEKKVNRRGDANAILDTLLILTGTRSVPKCWIQGQYVGNHRRLNRLAETGELGRLLKGLDTFKVYYPFSHTERHRDVIVTESQFYYDDEADAIRAELKRAKNLTDSQINEMYGG